MKINIMDGNFQLGVLELSRGASFGQLKVAMQNRSVSLEIVEDDPTPKELAEVAAQRLEADHEQKSENIALVLEGNADSIEDETDRVIAQSLVDQVQAHGDVTSVPDKAQGEPKESTTDPRNSGGRGRGNKNKNQ